MQGKAQIDEILRQKSDAKEIPGVVAIAASGNDVLYQGAFGKRDLSKPDAMTADSVFWIASMTKAVTSAGAMQLVDWMTSDEGQKLIGAFKVEGQQVFFPSAKRGK